MKDSKRPMIWLLREAVKESISVEREVQGEEEEGREKARKKLVRRRRGPISKMGWLGLSEWRGWRALCPNQDVFQMKNAKMRALRVARIEDGMIFNSLWRETEGW
jgi:hypothetical protein